MIVNLVWKGKHTKQKTVTDWHRQEALSTDRHRQEALFARSFLRPLTSRWGPIPLVLDPRPCRLHPSHFLIRDSADGDARRDLWCGSRRQIESGEDLQFVFWWEIKLEFLDPWAWWSVNRRSERLFGVGSCAWQWVRHQILFIKFNDIKWALGSWRGRRTRQEREDLFKPNRVLKRWVQVIVSSGSRHFCRRELILLSKSPWFLLKMHRQFESWERDGSGLEVLVENILNQALQFK